MNFKSVIAILFGLLVQWTAVAQVAAVTAGCQDAPRHHCDCCDTPASCHCVADVDHKPGPDSKSVLPETVKLPVLQVSKSHVAIEFAATRVIAGSACHSPSPETVAAYRGVSLAVAFCSFVI